MQRKANCTHVYNSLMNLVGIMPARNEAWILGLSVRVALKWCDRVIVRLDRTADNSADVLRAIQDEEENGRLIIVNSASDYAETTWDEMAHRNQLLQLAGAAGASHIALVDADEVLSRDVSIANLRGWIESTPGALLIPGYNLRNGYRAHASGIWSMRWFSVAFPFRPGLRWPSDRFHHREPEGLPVNPIRRGTHGFGGILHYWGYSEERLIAKHALYKITERLRWPEKPVQEIDRLYNVAVRGGMPEPASQWIFEAVPADRRWLSLEHHVADGDHGWIANECRRLVHQYGAETFRGLDLFGVL